MFRPHVQVLKKITFNIGSEKGLNSVSMSLNQPSYSLKYCSMTPLQPYGVEKNKETLNIFWGFTDTK